MFQTNDLVCYKVNSNGQRPYPNWTGRIISESVSSIGEPIYLVKFDSSYTQSNGVHLFGSDLERAPENMVQGFNK